jgi:hypothetical protein
LFENRRGDSCAHPEQRHPVSARARRHDPGLQRCCAIHRLEERAERSLDVEITSNTRSDELLVDLVESLRLVDALVPVLFDNEFAVGECALSGCG